MADELKQDEEQIVPTGADEALESDVAIDPEVSTEGEAVGGEVAAAAPVNENFKWYIIHAYSGFERKVKESLQSRVAAYHLEDKVGRIEIPTEPTTEMRKGARQRYVARGEEHAAGYGISADRRSAQCALRG
jgi:transcription termination/antitermination protein NusG